MHCRRRRVAATAALAVPAALAAHAPGARGPSRRHGRARDRQPEGEAKAGSSAGRSSVPTTKGITGASIHTGANGTVLVRLGTTYTKKGCTTASEMTLEHLESTPGKYSVWIDTKGHPGDLRGKLFAGMAHM